jgi:hypothetical protein
LFLEYVGNSGGIQSARTTQKDRALQQTNIGLRVHAVAAFGASWGDETEGFPRTQRRGRNPQAAGDFRDPEKALGGQRFRWFGEILST